MRSIVRYIVGFVLMCSPLLVFGAPYEPGETLDPLCSPGDTDCTISAVFTAEYFIATSTTGTSTFAGKLAIGTTDALSALTISGDISLYNSGDITGTIGRFLQKSNGELTLSSNINENDDYDNDSYGAAKLVFNPADNHLEFQTAGSGGVWSYNIPLHISLDTGNVGIGTTTTSSRLTIDGDVSVNNGEILIQDIVLRKLAAGTVAIGLNAGLNTTGSLHHSNFIGSGVGEDAVDVVFSNLIGAGAGYQANNVSSSDFIGRNAGSQAVDAIESIFIGYDSGAQTNGAKNSIFIGKQAGMSNTLSNGDFDSSILIGNYTSTGGFSNSIAIGQGTANSASDQLNLGGVLYATGISSGTSPSATPIGVGRVGIGTTSPAQQLSLTKSLRLENTSASDVGVIYKGADRFIHNFSHPTGGGAVPSGFNVFMGYNAGNFTMGSTATISSHSSYNIGIGYTAMFSNTTGSSNVAIGNSSLVSNTSGTFNAAVGTATLGLNTTGYYNAAFGPYALYGNTSSHYNSALGNNAGRYISDGSTQNSTSSTSVYLGSDTKSLFSGASNQIVIGYDAIGAGSNSVVLGSSTITKTLLQGNVGIGTTDPQQKLHVYRGSDGAPVRFEDTNGYCEMNPTTTTWTCTSDERLKKEIVELSQNTSLENLNKLQAVTFKWKTQSDNTKRFGFIAQQVEPIFPEFVTTDEKGFKSVAYGSFTPIIISAIQELDKKVQNLEQLIASSTPIASASSSGIIGTLLSYGVNIAHSIATFIRLETKNLYVENGIEMKDQDTGDIYCLVIASGQIQKTLGSCQTAGNIALPPPSAPEEDILEDDTQNDENIATSTASTTESIVEIVPPEVSTEEASSTPIIEGSTIEPEETIDASSTTPIPIE